MTGRTLHVVTHRRWVADDFTAALAVTRPDVTVRHHLGLDVPAFAPGDAMWAPMEWAARALHAGAPLDLVDPGPFFVTRIPPVLLGREVSCTRLSDVVAGSAPDEGFFKPANAKVEQAPARWWRRDAFVAAACSAGMTPDSLILWTPTRLDLAEEHRVFVLDGEPVTSSVYLRHHRSSGSEPVEETWHESMTDPHASEARAFAADVLAGLASTHTFPVTFTLDIGLLDGGVPGEWVVIETNPAWCAAQYGADLAVVADCLFAASEATNGWTWTPDPYLAEKAALQRRLDVESR